MLLSDIPAVYINLAKDFEKNENILTFLKQSGIKEYHRVDAIKGSHLNKSVSKWEDPSYASACVKSFIIALSKIPAPFLLLEDDATPTPYFTNNVSIPDDADFFYLGFSRFGIKNKNDTKVYRLDAFKKTDYPNTIKLTGMTSAHALIVLNEKSRLAMIEKIKSQATIIQDVSFAQMQAENVYNFYAAYPPLFYQPAIKAHTIPNEHMF